MEKTCRIYVKKRANYALSSDKFRSVRTFFMHFVYLDRENRIVKVIKSLKPFKIALPARNVVSILDIPSGVVDTEMLSS